MSNDKKNGCKMYYYCWTLQRKKCKYFKDAERECGNDGCWKQCHYQNLEDTIECTNKNARRDALMELLNKRI